MARPVTLAQWLECVDLPLEKCNAYRTRHGLPLLTQAGTRSEKIAEWDPSQPKRGFGDIVATITAAVGIKPCTGCKKRQNALNRLLPFRSTPTGEIDTHAPHLSRTNINTSLDSVTASQTETKQVQNLETFFEKVFVISLRSRTDRLHALLANFEKYGWPFKYPEVWEAVPGADGTVPCPTSFAEGGGAFGCRQSHVGILQYCLMNGVQSVLVLEDDAFIRDDFSQEVQKFLDQLPPDWQGIMLGGQHHAPPEKIQDGLFKVNYAQRTHAYAAKGAYIRALYAQWVNATVHIDWLMKGWQSGFRVFCPARWLIGQSRSRSDICGRTNAATFWNSIPTDEFGPVYLLQVPRTVMLQLRELGFHTGYSLNSDYMDEGLVKVFENESVTARENGLIDWLNVIQQECAQAEQLVTSVWHPLVTIEMLRKICRQPVYEVAGNTLEEALKSLPSVTPENEGSTQSSQLPILLLRADHAIVSELRKYGFHTGYWRDQISDMDNGLRSIAEGDFELSTRCERLRDWCRVLRLEADRFGGVVIAWHPLITRELFDAIGETIVEFEASSVEEAILKWHSVVSPSINETNDVMSPLVQQQDPSALRLNGNDRDQELPTIPVLPVIKNINGEPETDRGTATSVELGNFNSTHLTMAPRQLEPPSISFIIPSIGRDSLNRTLESLRDQLSPRDEAIVVFDGRDGVAHFIDQIAGLAPKAQFIVLPNGPSGDFGGVCRNAGIRLATCDFLAFIDDDDVYDANAVETIRLALMSEPDRPHMFRMSRSTYHDELWKVPRLAEGNVSTQMFVTPNIPEKLGKWTERYQGDYDFMISTVAYYADGESSIVWHPEIIARWNGAR